MAEPTQRVFEELQVSFGERFLLDHAGQIITEPRIALLELIANGYDAGATQVGVTWPAEKGGELSVADNGTGMTRQELERRWTTLCYERTKEQGESVAFPPKVKGLRRTAFGRNGKGRHAPFCFADVYRISTWKDGRLVTARIEKAVSGTSPFGFVVEQESDHDGHGTRIWANLERRGVSADDICQAIGSKFLMDPTFEIRVNGTPVSLLGLEGVQTTELEISGHGQVRVHQIDAVEQARSARRGGITWWVNRRMVGEPSWDKLDDDGAYLDGRTDEARRFSFVVEADILKEDVKPDWTDFYAGARVQATKDAIHGHVLKALERLLAGTRKARKQAALEHSRDLLAPLPRISKRVIGEFVDQVQEKCPNISQRDLGRTVEVMAKLEQARSGYELLAQLCRCSPDDLDTWNALLQRWTATEAEIVLGELERRLRLIEQLQPLVESTAADELHDLQPLFERGLWIFGPEYEAVEFRSNRTLAEVIRSLLGGTEEVVPRKRPDFVALPGRSVGTYSADSYDAGGEVAGIRKVLIVELKRGGFVLTQGEVDQARDYAKELRKEGRVQQHTEIVGYVLGVTLEDGLDVVKVGDRITIIPMTYETVLQRAHDRTFRLQRRIEEARLAVAPDEDVEEVLARPQQQEMYETPV